MKIPSFFDTVHYKNAPLANLADNYFFLKGISNRLGFRSFAVLSHTNRALTLQLLPPAQTQPKDILKTILKIVSYMTVILPVLMLAVKGAYRLTHSFKVTNPSAQLILDRRWHEYKNHPHRFVEVSLLDKLRRIEGEKHTRKDWKTDIYHQDPKGDPLIAFENDSASLFATMKSGRLDKQENIPELIEILKAGFATGRHIIGIPISHPTLPHGLAAAFSSDGRFRILDSCCDVSLDMTRLTQQLNAARIPDPRGRPIRFQGQFINTHIQKAGGECGSFAALYLYQILKKRNVDAFEEVNGAFAEGKLKRYEDHAGITCKKPLRDASSVPDSSYAPFMLSWAHRRLGMSVDRWQDVALQDILKFKSKRPAQFKNSPGCRQLGAVNWDICTIGKDAFHIRSAHQEAKAPLFIRDAAGNEKPAAPFTWAPTTRLGDLIPVQERTVILHDHEDSKLTVVKMHPGETLFAGAVQLT